MWGWDRGERWKGKKNADQKRRLRINYSAYSTLLYVLELPFLAVHLPSGLNWIKLIVGELHLYFNPLVLGGTGKCG